MPSRLSSLLVRDGLIGVKRMERAFQRQVIYGGALDTILLEMSLIDEPSLCDYLSLATGLPPATRGQMEVISSDATDLCSEQMALQFNVAPMAIDGDALRVLVCEPVDFAQLEDLADELDMAIQPLVAPEFRFHLLFDRAFGRSGDARFLKLAENVAAISPTRRPPSESLAGEEPIEPRASRAASTPTAEETDASSDAGDSENVADDSSSHADDSSSHAAASASDEADSLADADSVSDAADTTNWSASDSELDGPDTVAAGSGQIAEVDDAWEEPTVSDEAIAAADSDDAVVDDDPDREIVDVPLPPADASSQAVRATMRMSSDAVAARLGATLEARRITDAYRIVRPARGGGTGVPTEADEQLTPREVPISSQRRPPTEPIDVEPEPPFIDRGSERFSASYNAMAKIDAHGVLSGEIEEESAAESISDEPTKPYERAAVSETTGEAASETSSVPPPAAPGPLGSLSVADAEDLLERAEDRDLIFSLLLRGLSRVAQYAGLFAVQGGSAIGRMAIDNGHVDTANIATVLIPLDVPSPFQQVVHSKSPYIGKLASGNDAVDGQVVQLGAMPPSALLLPVVLRNRVIAVALGHGGDAPIEVTEVSEVFRLAEAAANALLRLIRSAKSKAANQLTDQAPVAEQPTERGEETDQPARARSLTPSSPVQDEEIEGLLDDIESEDIRVVSEAKRSLQGRSAEVVPLLDDRFPGKLRVDRYEVGWRTIRAGQYGQMMDLVIQLGAACGPMLAAKLRDPRRDIRYYAAVCAAELRPEATLTALVEALFDRDYGVRDIAIHALGGYPVRELKNALGLARRALDSDDNDRVMAAANALSVLGDLEAIPALLDVIEMDRDLAEPARRALRRLTAQDFGNSGRKWRGWWDKNAERPRVEWLLDALSHKDDELRRRAVDDLRALTGESFGYHADASKRERETARRQWLEWWDSSGRSRFEAKGERVRETAKIPRGL